MAGDDHAPRPGRAQANDATTTLIVGAARSIVPTYLAVFGIGGDYVFSVVNFLGIHLSLFGAVYYGYATLQRSRRERQNELGRRPVVDETSELLPGWEDKPGASSPTILSSCAALALLTLLVNAGSLYRGGKGT